MPKKSPLKTALIPQSPPKAKEDSKMKPKLLKRFYEVLVLLRVLGQVQGERLSGETFDDSNIDRMQIVDMRRKVMYHLCVMCDFQKGGDSVTAIAMENMPCGPRYWVGVNGCLNKIRKFLNEVLEMLQSQEYPTKPNALEDKLFEKFVSFQRTRIKEYWKRLQRAINGELYRVQSSPQQDITSDEYAIWLRNFQCPLEDNTGLHRLSRLAYDMRHSQFLRVAYDPITSSPTTMENESRADIRHYIGRLSAPRRAAVLLAYAATNLPALFEEFSIKDLGCKATSQRPIPHSGLTLSAITKRMLPANSPDLQSISEALLSLDDKGSIMSRIQHHYQSNDWQPRVHAELILLEALHYSKPQFYDDDKFIACSKPACFCCFHYIFSHAGGFVHPPCHNKIYLNWQPPELTTGSENQHRYQRDIMIKLTDQVRQVVIQRVLHANDIMKWHPDSSTGITPSEMIAVDQELSTSRCQTPDDFHSTLSQYTSDIEDNEEGGVALT